MNAAEYLIQGIDAISERGWIQGNLEDSGGLCLVGAINCNVTSTSRMGKYEETPGLVAARQTILAECEYCKKWAERRVLDAGETAAVVWRHNDICLESQEDALMILKKALHSVDGS